MKHYELTCLIASELPEQELNSLQERITSFIIEEKGILLETNRKRSKAILLLSIFQLEPGNLANLEKKLKAESQILRFLILAKKPSRPDEVIKIYPKVVKPKRKVEIGEIEKKLEEILGE